jgi:hypothetical protein
MKVRSFFLAGVAAVAVGSLTACSSMAAGPASSSNRNVVTGEELESTNSPMVYQALEIVRPQWMSSRGVVSVTDSQEARANVYMNGTRVGDLDYLRQVYVADVAELRFWPAGEAAARFGMGNPRGVIEIILKT